VDRQRLQEERGTKEVTGETDKNDDVIESLA
jgi:hypothetical protein